MLNAFQTEYLAEEDPIALWLTLEERFDYQKMIYLFKGRYDWQNLRFQDFKSVNEYNLKFVGSNLSLNFVRKI